MLRGAVMTFVGALAMVFGATNCDHRFLLAGGLLAILGVVWMGLCEADRDA